MLKRAIKRPSGNATMLFLLPLLCALLLLLSGCRDVEPPSTDDSGNSATASGVTETDKDSQAPPEPSEDSSNVLKRDDLEPNQQADLDVLVQTVSAVSENVKAFESSPGDLSDILTETKTWLDDLKTKTDSLLLAIHDLSFYQGKEAPGLQTMSNRLADMLYVIDKNLSTEQLQDFDKFKTPEEAVDKLRAWVDELTVIAQALPDVPTSVTINNGTGEGDGNTVTVLLSDEKVLDAVQGLSDSFSGLSGTMNKVFQTVQDILAKVEKIPTETPHLSFGWLGVIVLVLLGMILVLLVLVVFLWRDVRSLKKQIPEGDTMKKEVDEVADNVARRVNEHSTREIAKMFSLISPVTPIPEPPPPEPKPETELLTPEPKPETHYFAVTSKTVKEGEPIHLEKQANRGEIVGISRNDSPTNNRPEVYEIYPVMDETKKDNVIKGGHIQTSLLTSGDIKKCFDMPQRIPTGKDCFVTVTKPAIIYQPKGSNQYLLEWNYRGQLNV